MNMARRTAQQVAKKWATSMQGAATAMRDGVAAVTQSPTAKAADAVDKYRAGVMKAIDDGTYQAGLRSVTLDQWKQSMLQKGIGRVADGVAAAGPKMERFMGELLAHTDMVSQEIQGMPSLTKEDRKQRMLRNFELMSEFRSSRRR